MIHCLIIDDNSFDRKTVRRAAEGCELKLKIREASNIKSAEEMIKTDNFDCIILDFLLPDEDGLSFARRFLSTTEGMLPIIMLTGQGSEKLVRDAFQLGILDYLTKENLSPESLERGLINALAKVHIERSRRAHQDELKRSNEALGRFATLVAHDLKTPISQIKASCGSLGKKYRDALDDDDQKLLRRAEHAANHAYKLINSMLAFAQLGKPSQLSNRVDLRLAVDDAIATLATMIQTANATIEIGDLPAIFGDEVQITQLFQNLISNALKFRRSNCALVIRIAARPVSRNAWEISVEDNGIGIALDNQERIFDMLERLHGKDEFEGSGIGLAACKRIVENHEGRIWCRSALGVGSEFVFTMKRYDGAASAN